MAFLSAPQWIRILLAGQTQVPLPSRGHVTGLETTVRSSPRVGCVRTDPARPHRSPRLVPVVTTVLNSTFFPTNAKEAGCKNLHHLFTTSFRHRKRPSIIHQTNRFFFLPLNIQHSKVSCQRLHTGHNTVLCELNISRQPTLTCPGSRGSLKTTFRIHRCNTAQQKGCNNERSFSQQRKHLKLENKRVRHCLQPNAGT